MIPWEVLDSAAVPGSRGELTLHRRGEEFCIRIDGLELMNSRSHGSEEALARIACLRIRDLQAPRVLIGGLGMGYTLAAALRHLRREGPQVTVAEVAPAVIQWNRGPLAALAGQPLLDPRVTALVGDVADALRDGSADYDAILLDVDNGPEGLTRKANDWLYALSGLKTAFSALRPGGVLGVWSSTPDKAFTQRLRRVGFRVDDLRVPARPGSGRQHTIWIAEHSSA